MFVAPKKKQLQSLHYNNYFHFTLQSSLWKIPKTLSLRTCRSSSVNFSWFLVWNFCRTFVGNFAGFWDPLNKGSKTSGKISEHFSWQNSCLEKDILCQLRSADLLPSKQESRKRAPQTRCLQSMSVSTMRGRYWRRCGVNNEIPNWLFFWFCAEAGQLSPSLVVGFGGIQTVDAEFSYRVRIVDRATIEPHPCLPPPFWIFREHNAPKRKEWCIKKCPQRERFWPVLVSASGSILGLYY